MGMKLRITAIKPKPIDPDVYAKEIEHEYDLLAKDIKRDLEAITRTWVHKVKFNVRKTRRSGMLGITVTTSDKIFGYVNFGTEPHVIKPKKSSVLAFQSKYKAKTRPGWIGSQPGGPYGETVFAKEVQHPGSEARKFDVAIAQRRQKTLQSRMNRRLALVARKNRG